jgi:hypothetical protein
VRGNPQGPRVWLLSRESADHVELDSHTFLRLQIAQSDFQDRSLGRIRSSHHHGYTFVFSLFELGLHFFLLLDNSFNDHILVDGADPRNAEIGIGGNRVVNFKCFFEGVSVDLA